MRDAVWISEEQQTVPSLLEPLNSKSEPGRGQPPPLTRLVVREPMTAPFRYRKGLPADSTTSSVFESPSVTSDHFDCLLRGRMPRRDSSLTAGSMPRAVRAYEATP